MTEIATHGKIHLLSEEISSRIAAGEAVERPAAVVKELVDNSLDAGSSMITVAIEEGGRRSIRVTDNGEGMCREDAQLACQRFATSKLTSDQDLFQLTSLGFRGEALPSIASVSKFRLLTLPRGECIGTELYAEGGINWTSADHSIPAGTQVEVRELFFNTPGRQKFLKSASTEFSKICHTVQQAALSWPTTHFRLIHNGHAVADFPAVLSCADRFLQVYGNRFCEQSLPVNHESGEGKLEGFISSPYHCRTTRSIQELFVNRRPVKNATISHAIYEAYESFLPKGRHPAFVLFVDLDPAMVDVNVHPAKREIRFTHSHLVHGMVKQAIRRPLSQHQPDREHACSTNPHPWLGKQEMRSSQIVFPDVSAMMVQADPSQKDSPFVIRPLERESDHKSLASERASVYSVEQDLDVVPLGQVHHTFLVAQVNTELHIIDQHTAHERVLFERLWRAWTQQSVQTQALLIPEPIDLPPHEGDLLAEYLSDLLTMGLEVERFGTHSFVVRSVPAMLGPMTYSNLIQELLQDLSEWKSVNSLEKKVRPMLASFACQGAVQAGRAMTDPEIKQVVMDWGREGFPMTCPHGRRIALRFSLNELQRIFGRDPKSG